MAKAEILLSLLAILLFTNLASAVIINSVDVSEMSPGQEGTIRLEVENILSDDVQEVSILLDFKNIPFTPVGTSEESVDEIEEDDEESFVFRIRAANDVVAGDYEIPYTLTYEVNEEEKTRTGTIGVKVTANPDLVFSISTDNPVQGMQGRITLQVINKGLFDARFVSVRILPADFTLLSENEVYIGEIESDDFETVNFDVIFEEENTNFNAIVEYRDFNNTRIIKTVDLPVKVYTVEEAQQLGILTKSQTAYYIVTVVLVIILIILWRSWRKRRRLKRSERLKEEK